MQRSSRTARQGLAKLFPWAHLPANSHARSTRASSLELCAKFSPEWPWCRSTCSQWEYPSSSYTRSNSTTFYHPKGRKKKIASWTLGRIPRWLFLWGLLKFYFSKFLYLLIKGWNRRCQSYWDSGGRLRIHHEAAGNRKPKTCHSSHCHEQCEQSFSRYFYTFNWRQ